MRASNGLTKLTTGQGLAALLGLLLLAFYARTRTPSTPLTNATKTSGPLAMPADLAATRLAAWEVLVSAPDPTKPTNTYEEAVQLFSSRGEKLLPVLEALHDLQERAPAPDVGCLPPAVPDWVQRLGHAEAKMYSQHGEDGLLLGILLNIGVQERKYVEFGTQDCSECNSRVVRDKLGWEGLMMDGGYENLAINLRKEFITRCNINDLFVKYNVTTTLDLLSIDVDFEDWCIWKAIDSKYRPRVVIIETAAGIPPNISVAVDPDDPKRTGTKYYGGSLLAMVQLGKKKGYTLVAMDSQGVNSIFVRSDILACQGVHVPPIEELYRYVTFGQNGAGHPPDPDRPWLYLDMDGRVVRRGKEEWQWVSKRNPWQNRLSASQPALLIEMFGLFALCGHAFFLYVLDETGKFATATT